MSGNTSIKGNQELVCNRAQTILIHSELSPLHLYNKLLSICTYNLQNTTIFENS